MHTMVQNTYTTNMLLIFIIYGYYSGLVKNGTLLPKWDFRDFLGVKGGIF